MSKTDSNPLVSETAMPTNVYTGRGMDYATSQPGYPAAAIDTLLKGLGEPSKLTAADIGAGTGISSRLLADRGVHVMAVEPNASMRQAADPIALIEFRDADAERTGLPDASVDLVTCFASFHWFNPDPTLAEFRRILRPLGRLALVWYGWAPGDKFSEEMRSLIFKAMSNDPPNPGGSAKQLASNANFVRIRRYTFEHRHELDLSGLIRYAQSLVFVPREGEAQQQLVSDLHALHARCADESGLVCLALRITVHLADPRLEGWSVAPARRLQQGISELLRNAGLGQSGSWLRKFR